MAGGWMSWVAAVIVGLCATASADPYVAPVRPGQDGLTFWGWSSDGQFAYETYSSGERDDVDCREAAVLQVIDAVHDRPVANGVLRVAGTGRDAAGQCRELDVRAALAAQRPAFLARHHIVASSPPVRFTSKRAGMWTIARPGGGEIAVQLTETKGPDQRSASYRLVFHVRPDRDIAVSTPPIPGALGFDLDESMVFYDPAQQHVAVLVSQIDRAHHGTWATWTSHGLVIPGV